MSMLFQWNSPPQNILHGDSWVQRHKYWQKVGKQWHKGGKKIKNDVKLKTTYWTTVRPRLALQVELKYLSPEKVLILGYHSTWLKILTIFK